MPPRHTKSEFASVYFPAWIIGKNPKMKLMQVSHNAELSARFAMLSSKQLGTLTSVDCFALQVHLTLGSIVLFPRCISAHTRPDKQNLFPIVQGGLEEEKRKDCAAQVLEMHC